MPAAVTCPVCHVTFAHPIAATTARADLRCRRQHHPLPRPHQATNSGSWMTGACTTRTTVACYAITTDHDNGVPQHVAGRVHTHPGGTLPWHTSTDVAGVTTVVEGEPSIRSINSPELAGHWDTDGDFPVADSSRDWDPDVCLVVPNSPR